MTQLSPTLIGAGPASLTAAYAFVERGIRPILYEADTQVGGISRTVDYHGCKLDIGGHRFYTQSDLVQHLWHTVLGDEFVLRPRLSRIYYNGEFFPYPLDVWATLKTLGLQESVWIGLSYLRWQFAPYPQEDTFEEWVTNRFGQRLYETFFKTYTEKVWGISCKEIRADWAAQRIQDLSLRRVVSQAILPRILRQEVRTLIEQFHYPKHGPGMMWERFAQHITAHGGQVHLNHRVTELHHTAHHVHTLRLNSEAGEREQSVESVISSMPLRTLMHSLRPLPPSDVLAAADGLRYRDFLIVGLIINRTDLFPDNWLYIHTPQIRVGRIQNFKNWSADMVSSPEITFLGMEYFCNEGDDLWTMADADLGALAARELEQLGLGQARDVVDSVVIRQRKAYPVYDEHYQAHLGVIRAYLEQFDNLQTIGRNGLHRYNNQDHSMLTGYLAALNTLGETHDVWSVNLARSYYEQFVVQREKSTVGGA